MRPLGKVGGVAECGCLENKKIAGLLLLGTFLIGGILYAQYIAVQAVEKGLKYCASAHYDEAIAEFNKAIGLDPVLARAYNDRGLAYSFKDEFDQAISDYSKSIAFNPYNAPSYVNRAVAYYFKQEYAKAWEDERKAESLGSKVNQGFLKILKTAFEKKK